MAIGKRLDKKISSMIEGALALHLDINNIKKTTFKLRINYIHFGFTLKASETNLSSSQFPSHAICGCNKLISFVSLIWLYKLIDDYRMVNLSKESGPRGPGFDLTQRGVVSSKWNNGRKIGYRCDYQP